MPLYLGPRPLVVSQGRQVMVQEESKLSGGLDIVSADDALGETMFRRGDNGRLTPFGAFLKRGGTQRTAAALNGTVPVRSGYTWNKSDGTSVVLAVAGGALHTTSYGAFPLTWTLRGANPSMSTTVPPGMVHFISATSTEAVYIADGGLLNKYQGTTLTTNIATTPSCNQLAVHNERLWGCGDAAFPDSIFYSALNDGDTLGIGASGGGQIVVRTFGSENVIGLKSLGTSLMIVHPRGISRLTGYGQSDVTVSPAGITKDVGTIAPFSLVVVDNLLYFVSERGLYVASEQDVAPVNTPQQPDPLSVVLPAMTVANIANIRTELNRATREILIAVPGAGIFVYHTILKAWSGPWTDGYLVPETSSLFESVNASGYPIVLRGDNSGFVSETDRSGVGLDNVAADGSGGTVYTMALQCRRFFCGEPHMAKSWRYVYVLASLNGSNSTTITCLTDSTSDAHSLPPSVSGIWGSGTWGVGTWGGLAQISYRNPMAGQGYFVDVLITDSGTSEPLFSQVRVQGFLLGRR